jgi:hypothetical protein
MRAYDGAIMHKFLEFYEDYAVYDTDALEQISNFITSELSKKQTKDKSNDFFRHLPVGTVLEDVAQTNTHYLHLGEGFFIVKRLDTNAMYRMSALDDSDSVVSDSDVPNIYLEDQLVQQVAQIDVPAELPVFVSHLRVLESNLRDAEQKFKLYQEDKATPLSGYASLLKTYQTTYDKLYSLQEMILASIQTVNF